MEPLTNSQKAYAFFKRNLRLDVEEVWIVALNSQMQVLATTMLHRGTIEYCPISFRDALYFACLHRASGFMICHSHPSGDCQPSRQDLSITRNLRKLGDILQVPLHDHLIISTNGFCSLADRGFFRKRGSPLIHPDLLESTLKTGEFSRPSQQ